MNDISFTPSERERKFPRFHAITGKKLRRNMAKDLLTMMPHLTAIAESGANPLTWLLTATPQSLEFRAMLIDLAEAVGGDVWPKLSPTMSTTNRSIAGARTLKAINKELALILKGWKE
jgi:hypothetical protein